VSSVTGAYDNDSSVNMGEGDYLDMSSESFSLLLLSLLLYMH